MTDPYVGDMYSGRGSTPVPDPTVLTTQALAREITALKELVAVRLDAMDKAQVLFDGNLNRVPTDIDREISHLRDFIDERFRSIDNGVDARDSLREEMFRSVQTQIEERDDRFAQAQVDTEKAISTALVAVEKQIVPLRDLSNEKFESIAKQFAERDTRAERESRDNKVAVDAAFAAQKEAAAKQDEANQKAIDKSERATAETLNKQADLFKSTTDALADKIAAVSQEVSKGMTRNEIEAQFRAMREQFDHNEGRLISLVAVFVSIAAVVVAVVVK